MLEVGHARLPSVTALFMPAICVSNLQQLTFATGLCNLPYINSHTHLLC